MSYPQKKLRNRRNHRRDRLRWVGLFRYSVIAHLRSNDARALALKGRSSPIAIRRSPLGVPDRWRTPLADCQSAGLKNIRTNSIPHGTDHGEATTCLKDRQRWVVLSRLKCKDTSPLFRRTWCRSHNLIVGCPSAGQAALVNHSRTFAIQSAFCACHVRLKKAHTMGSGEHERILLASMLRGNESSLSSFCITT